MSFEKVIQNLPSMQNRQQQHLASNLSVQFQEFRIFVEKRHKI